MTRRRDLRQVDKINASTVLSCKLGLSNTGPLKLLLGIKQWHWRLYVECTHITESSDNQMYCRNVTATKFKKSKIIYEKATQMLLFSFFNEHLYSPTAEITIQYEYKSLK